MGLVNFMISPAGRLARIGAGIALIVLGLVAIGGAAGIAVAVLGLVPITAGAVNVCLLGPLFGADFWGRPKGRPKGPGATPA
jgi:hypothetical protein